jgi:hypothetical protein
MSERSSDNGAASLERSPWSRPSVLLSGAFLLALVLLGLVVAATNGGRSGPGHSANTATRAAGHTAGPAAAGASVPASGCGLAAGGQTVPSSRPPAARWGTVGSMQVPQNPAVYGPQRTTGIWNACFARNPSGALLAAVNFYGESTTGQPEATVMRRYAVGAPSDLGSNAGLDSGGPVQLAGYHYDSYTPSRAQISLVFTGPQGKQAAVVTSMVWQRGDWKYVFPPGGMPAYQVVTDLTGYVAWTDF